MMDTLSASSASIRAKRTFFAFVIVALMTTDTNADENSVSPANGFVPDGGTAVAVAEAILIPIYGRTQVELERPFSASFGGGNWTVVGNLPAGYVGGVAKVIVEKMTGRIVSVTHGK
jgi:hypothetical protein